MRKTNQLLTIQWATAFLAFFCLMTTGCRDNPQDKAAKEVHREVQSALTEADKTVARRRIESAIAATGPAGLAQASATLVAANLTLDEGLSRRGELMRKFLPLNAAIDAIDKELKRSQELLLEKERIEQMLALHNKEISELQELLNGAADQNGLRARLNEAKKELADLTARKESLVQQKNDIQAVIDQSQAQAEDLLRQADLAKGEEKLTLQQKAYALMLERKEDYVQVQAVENQIAILDDQIALAALKADQLAESIQKTEQKIQALQADPGHRMLEEQRVEIDRLLSDHQENIAGYADALNTHLEAYRQTAQEAFELFQQAAEYYQKAKTPDVVAASFRLADSFAYAAMTYADQMTTQKNLARRLSEIMSAVDETLVRGLPERLALTDELNMETFQAAVDLFDKADQAYEEALQKARSLPARGREAAGNIFQNRLLALYAKMRLADAVGQYDPAAEVQTRLNDLKAAGQEEFGTAFSQSEVARLIEQGLNYVPAMPVDVELYFEGIRQELTQWKLLANPQQQAAAVEQKLAQMEQLIKVYGEEMARLLEPIRQEMEEAKARNFAAPTQPAAAGADPNRV